MLDYAILAKYAKGVIVHELMTWINENICISNVVVAIYKVCEAYLYKIYTILLRTISSQIVLNI